MTNQSIANLTDTYGLVVTHQDLTAHARQRTPSAVHVSVENFMNARSTTRSSNCSEGQQRQRRSPRRGGTAAGGNPAPAEDVLDVESIVLVLHGDHPRRGDR